MNKEALARIKINKLLEDAGWRFFDTEDGRANIQLEPNVKLKQSDIDNMGENFEKTKNGFVDYLLLDEQDRPFVVVEAKKESIHPLDAKEQARKYANQLRAKYVILTNGNMHYFWNLEKGNPEMITTFPAYESLTQSKALTGNTDAITEMIIDKYFIATSQDPTLTQSSAWKSGDDKVLFDYCWSKGIRVLRDYQLNGIKAVQNSIQAGNTRFLLEMATGTGKTLTSAGIVKMFIRSDLAHWVLFLVDRIELENQAKKDLSKYLGKDGIRVEVYKENKQDWNSADVVISTIQSFTHDDKYKKIFSPIDFDLVISDEAHRSLGASNRAVFEYFIGYKLGLTATPKNYLKGVDFDEEDPRELEKRILLDTYHIFGCESGNPTFSYTLNDGVRDGILINPTIVDARTDITTELLSEKGLTINIEEDDVDVTVKNTDGRKTKVFTEKGFEKTFFSESTNRVLCKTFIDNALRDPITNEIGKSIVFCVNVQHARKITEILNDFADQKFPGKYNSDFAVQITSNVVDAQQMTMNFANNNLMGHTKWLEDYESSKARVAVTVGMMTTGYDCPDILNLGIFRPIFSPSEFIQIKGRGTRLNTFKYEDRVEKKVTFKLFDFFAVCEYFEDKFEYDAKINLPKVRTENPFPGTGGDDPSIIDKVIHNGADSLLTMEEEIVPEVGMKIDRMLYKNFEEKVKEDPNVQKILEEKDIEALEWYLKEKVFDKPNEYYNTKKLEQSLGLDRKLTVREIAMNILGFITGYKTKTEKLKDEFENFKLLNKDELEICADKIPDIEAVFQAYILNSNVRELVKAKTLTPLFNMPIKENLRNLAGLTIRNRTVLEYISDYISENDINCDNFK